ncbi:hypothetical protein IAT40_001434 [Kwoniella sp. CBS 6097]
MSNGFGSTTRNNSQSLHQPHPNPNLRTLPAQLAQPLEPRQRYPVSQQPDLSQAYHDEATPFHQDAQSILPSPLSLSDSRQQRVAQPLSRGRSMGHMGNKTDPAPPPSQGRSSLGTRYDRSETQSISAFGGAALPGPRPALEERQLGHEDSENKPPSPPSVTTSILKNRVHNTPRGVPTDQPRGTGQASLRVTTYGTEGNASMHETNDYPPGLPQSSYFERPRGRSFSRGQEGDTPRQRLSDRLQSAYGEGDHSMEEGFSYSLSQGAPTTLPVPRQTLPMNHARSRSMPSAAPPSTFEDHSYHPEFDNLATFDSYAQGKLGAITDAVQKIQAEKALLREELSSKLQLIQSMKNEIVRCTLEAALSRQEVQKIREKSQALANLFSNSLVKHEAAIEALRNVEQGRRNSLDKQLEDKGETEAAFKKEVAEVANKTDVVSTSNATLRTMLKSLEEDLRKAEEEGKSAESKVKLLERELRDARSNIVKLETTVKHYENLVHTELANLNEKLPTLGSNSGGTLPEIQKTLQMTLELHRQLELRDKEVKDLLQEKQNIAKNRDTYLERITEIEDYLKQRGYDMDEIEGVITQLEEQHLAEMKEVTSSRDQKILDAEYRVRALVAEIKSLEKQVAEVNTLRGAKEKQAVEHTASMTKLQAKLDSSVEDLDRLKQEHAAQAAEAQKKIAHINKSEVEQKNRCLRLEAAVLDKDTKIDKLTARIEDLEGQLLSNQARTNHDRDTRSPYERWQADKLTSGEMELVQKIQDIQKIENSKNETIIQNLRKEKHALQAQVKKRSNPISTSETAEEDEPSGPSSVSGKAPVQPTSNRQGVHAPFKSPLAGTASSRTSSAKRTRPSAEDEEAPIPAAEKMKEISLDEAGPQNLDEDDAEWEAAIAAVPEETISVSMKGMGKRVEDGGKGSKTYGGMTVEEGEAPTTKRRKPNNVIGDEASNATATTDRPRRSASNQASQQPPPASQSSRRERVTKMPANSQSKAPAHSQPETSRSGRTIKRVIPCDEDDESSSEIEVNTKRSTKKR